MIPFDYKLLLIRLLPESILVLGGLIALFLDQARTKSWSVRNRSVTAVFVGLLSILFSVLVITRQMEFGSFYNGMLQNSPFIKWVKIGLLILAAATLLIGSPEKFTPHLGEYIALILFATVGLLLLVGTEELLTAFIALELTSLSLYMLTAFNKSSAHSAEAALKYFLFGSVAAAFTLFGISLVYGLGGSTNFERIAASLSQQSLSPLLVLGLVLTVIGFGFKMAAAPLHLWAPDAYQGAPIPSAALIASGSKLASFVLFLKFFLIAVPGQVGSASWGGAVPGWAIAIAALAATSMIVGNLLAIAQTNLRRLIAYSAIAHAGYVLIALLASSQNGIASAIYYLFTYGLTVIGIFGIIGLIEERHGELSFSELSGLNRRSPLLAICLLVFILSLAGIPPLAGFFAKFYVFLAALDASRTAGVPGLLWIVVLAIAASAVSLYYYLLVLKHAFVADGGPSTAISAPARQKLTIALLAAAVLLFGCFPNTILRRLQVPGSNPPVRQEQNHDHDHHDGDGHDHGHHGRNPVKSAHLFANLR